MLPREHGKRSGGRNEHRIAFHNPATVAQEADGTGLLRFMTS